MRTGIYVSYFANLLINLAFFVVICHNVFFRCVAIKIAVLFMVMRILL